jgi:hypothetical protein
MLDKNRITIINRIQTTMDDLRAQIWLRTHTDFQDDMGHLYSVSIFSWEFLSDSFKTGGPFWRVWHTLINRCTHRNRTLSDTDLDDCPF